MRQFWMMMVLVIVFVHPTTIAISRYIDRQEAQSQARLPTSDKKEEPVMKPDRPRPLPPKPDEDPKPAKYEPMPWAECIEKQVPEDLCDYRTETYTYILNIDGTLTFVCQSLGFGLQRFKDKDAKYAICIDPSDKKAKVVYIEFNIIVSEYVLANDGGSLQASDHHKESQQ